MFWGIQLKPGKTEAYVPPPMESKLHLSTATLELKAKKGERVCVMCRTGSDEGEEQDLIICSLVEGRQETVSVDLIFSEYTEFRVTGSSAVHLTGYHMPMYEAGDQDDEDDDEDDDDDDDDDDELQHMSQAQLKKLFMQQGGLQMVDSEDEDEDEDEEDGDPTCSASCPPMCGSKQKKSGVVIKQLDEGDEMEGSDDDEEEEDDESEEESEEEEEPAPKSAKRKPVAPEPVVAKKAKADTPAEAKKPESKKEVKAKTPKKEEKGGTTPGKERVKTYPNGLEVHTVSLGNAKGKEATPGKRVVMKYEGRLKSNNKVFDSTKGKGPFDFRLGVGEVIKGWDVGVKGMRVGDKRKLVIPPGMAYGREGVRGTIPPNAWLVFDIELMNVK